MIEFSLDVKTPCNSSLLLFVTCRWESYLKRKTKEVFQSKTFKKFCFTPPSFCARPALVQVLTNWIQTFQHLSGREQL